MSSENDEAGYEDVKPGWIECDPDMRDEHDSQLLNLLFGALGGAIAFFILELLLG